MPTGEDDLRDIGALELASKIYEIGLLAIQSLDLQELLKTIADRLLKETDACYVGITLVDRARQRTIHSKGATRDGTSIPEGHVGEVGRGVVGQVVATGRPIHLSDVSLFSDYVGLLPDMRSELCVPLKIGDAVIGALNIESRELGKFGPEVMALLQALSTSLAQAIQNARLIQDDRRRLHRLNVLNRVSRIVSSTVELEPLMQRTVKAIRDQLGCYVVSIGLIDEDGQSVSLRAMSSQGRLDLPIGHSQKLGVGVVGEVVLTGASLLISDVTQWTNYVPAGDNIRCEMCCPFKVGQRLIGCLDAQSTEVGAFDEEDLLLFETLAEQISQAVENARNLRRFTQLRDDLSSMVVHDLRNPITIIQSTLQMLTRRLQSLDEQRAPANPEERAAIPAGYGTAVEKPSLQSYVTHAQRACDEMLVLIEGLLELQKIESGELQLHYSHCAPGDVLQSVAKRMAVVADSRQITLTVHAAEQLPAARLDLDLIARVLNNLVANALKFTPGGGRVTLLVDQAPRPLLVLHLSGADDGLLFTVQDTGPGIPLEERERIFDKFGTVEARKAGHKHSTGLGLAFCHQAIKAHGGVIWVDSTPDEGSTFSILIPLQ